MRKTSWKLTATAAVSLASILAPAVPVNAQTFSVLHTFTGGSDGGSPVAGLAIDKAGNLYGTAAAGGAGYGTAFELKHARTGWTYNVVHTFASGADGAAPGARLIPGPQGHLYSTTPQGGGGGGTVFELGAAAQGGLRKETELYTFANSGNGYQPSNGDLAFDAKGNVYGTTSYGGANNAGAVFKLTKVKGQWNETVIHSFGASGDGSVPIAGVIFDAAGNLYGTTSAGGSAGYGTVYQLVPSGSGWNENILYNFQAQGDGETPYAGLTFDKSGNLYGGATDGGANNGGTLFVLTPAGGGTWGFNVLYSTPGWGISGPFRVPYVDANGNVFGTTHCDGLYSAGSIYELTRSGSTWNYTSLHDFTGGSDGGFVFSPPVFDAHGDVFGTTQIGGSGYGVVWEISP